MKVYSVTVTEHSGRILHDIKPIWIFNLIRALLLWRISSIKTKSNSKNWYELNFCSDAIDYLRSHNYSC